MVLVTVKIFRGQQEMGTIQVSVPDTFSAGLVSRELSKVGHTGALTAPTSSVLLADELLLIGIEYHLHLPEEQPGMCAGQLVTQQQLAQHAQRQQQETAQLVERAQKRARAVGSFKTPIRCGAALLQSLPPTPDSWLRQLPALDTMLLQRLLRDADASRAWSELQQRREQAEATGKTLLEEHVQRFYNTVLQRLKELSNPHSLYVVDTSQGALGYGRKNPDLAVSLSRTALLAGTLYFVELKGLLQATGSHNEASSQAAERVEMLQNYQPGRQHFFTVSAAADALELWHFDDGVPPQPSERSGLFPLQWNAQSEGLQALVRAWSFAPQQVGYQVVSLPEVRAPDGTTLTDVEPLMFSSATHDQDLHRRPCLPVLKGNWKDQLVVAKASAPNDLTEEDNLRVMVCVPGVVKLVDVVASEGGGRWLLMKPEGDPLPGEPANTVLRHIGELATTTDALVSAEAMTRAHANLEQGWPTGTPLFMALRVLEYQEYSLTTELESLFYVLLFIATRKQLPWKGTSLSDTASFERKCICMTHHFEKRVLPLIEDERLRQVAVSLQGLLFPGHHWVERHEICVNAFLSALG
ncbi:g432 [Coccomyxa elongata]